MIKINLLPFRAARKKENVRRQVSIFMVFLGAVLVVLVCYSMFLNGKIDDTAVKVAQLKKEVEIYEKKAKEVDAIKKKLAVLNNKTKIIKKLEADRKAPLKLLEAMSQSVIAKRMWLTKLDAKGKDVKLKGIALDNKTVADFMTRLEETKLYSSVNLAKLSKSKIKNMDLKQFDINCVNPSEKKTSHKKKRRKKKR
jgi:type IV pilus assembly protein PilN